MKWRRNVIITGFKHSSYALDRAWGDNFVELYGPTIQQIKRRLIFGSYKSLTLITFQERKRDFKWALNKYWLHNEH